MLDCPARVRVAAGRAREAHLLLVGDTDQLPQRRRRQRLLKDLIAAGGSRGEVATTSSRQDRGGGFAAAPSIPVNPFVRHLPPKGPERHRHRRACHQFRRPVAAAHGQRTRRHPGLERTSRFVAAADAEDCLRKVTALCTEFVPRLWKWLESG